VAQPEQFLTNGTNKKSTHPAKKNKPVDILLNKLGRQALAASPPKHQRMHVNSTVDRNVPVKIPGKADASSKFYVSLEDSQNGQFNSVQARAYDLQNRTRHAVNRLLKASENLEKQGIPQQGPIIVELKDIASLLNGALINEEELMIAEPPSYPVQQLPSRSNSISNKPMDIPTNQRKSTLNGKECEMVEMHFARKKNY